METRERRPVGERVKLTPGLERELLKHGDWNAIPHLGLMRALAARGLVTAKYPAVGCRLWSCWPLTLEGEATRATLAGKKGEGT